MINALSWSGKIALMASEEIETEIVVDNCDDPKYVVVFDPLDGSSNIDANVSVGTIFGILKVKSDVAKGQKPSVNEDLLQTGTNLVCSGYAMYGDATMLVLTFGDQVNGFTLDPQIGEFILTHRNIKIPEKGKIYSVNEGNSRSWDPVIQQLSGHPICIVCSFSLSMTMVYCVACDDQICPEVQGPGCRETKKSALYRIDGC